MLRHLISFWNVIRDRQRLITLLHTWNAAYRELIDTNFSVKKFFSSEFNQASPEVQEYAFRLVFFEEQKITGAQLKEAIRNGPTRLPILIALQTWHDRAPNTWPQCTMEKLDRLRQAVNQGRFDDEAGRLAWNTLKGTPTEISFQELWSVPEIVSKKKRSKKSDPAMASQMMEFSVAKKKKKDVKHDVASIYEEEEKLIQKEVTEAKQPLICLSPVKKEDLAAAAAKLCNIIQSKTFLTKLVSSLDDTFNCIFLTPSLFMDHIDFFMKTSTQQCKFLILVF
jgi:hypothetical protein